MRAKRRQGVSELYASLLMVGVTLSFGTAITASAINQFNLSGSSASLASAVQQASSGKLVSLIYGTVAQSGSCPAYGGYNEGTAYTLVVYNYGTAAFTPAEAFVNSTLVSGGPYGGIASDSLATYTLTLPSCSHPSGQTFLLVDSYGDEAQIGT